MVKFFAHPLVSYVTHDLHITDLEMVHIIDACKLYVTSTKSHIRLIKSHIRL